MKASVLIAGDTAVEAGDYLAHAGNGTSKPTAVHSHVDPATVPIGAYARVIDPTPGERDANGHYRVRCELLMRRTYIPRAA